MQLPAADDPPLRPRIRALLLRLPLVALVLGGIAWVALAAMHSETTRENPVQAIRLLEAPPPPPEPDKEDPPEPIEPPPEPRLPEYTEVEPADEPVGEPPAEGLGLDTDGSGGTDGFGLGARRGGRSLLDPGRDGTGERFARYALTIARQLERLMSGNAAATTQAWTVELRVWLARDGSIRDAELARSSGDRILDRGLIDLLSATAERFAPPPPDLPQPVHVRVRSRRPG